MRLKYLFINNFTWGRLVRYSRFSYSHPALPNVEKIYNSIIDDTGVFLDWHEGKWKHNEHFSFPELAMKRIKVLDLISNPELFRIDLEEHEIYISQLGRSSY